MQQSHGQLLNHTPKYVHERYLREPTLTKPKKEENILVALLGARVAVANTLRS